MGAVLDEFGILIAAGIFGSLCLIPSLMQLLTTPNDVGRASSASMLSFLARDVALMTACVVFGLPAAHAVGLGLPIIDRLLAGQDTVDPYLATFLVPVTVFGGGVGLLSALTIMLYTLASRSQLNLRLVVRPLHEAFVDAIHAAFTEEIVSRLGAFAILFWLLSWVLRFSGYAMPQAGFWAVAAVVAIGNAIASTAGIGMMITGISRANFGVAALLFLTVIFVIALIGGIGFGYFFWRFGLEAAALSHLTMAVAQNLVTVQSLGLHPFEGRAGHGVAEAQLP